MSCSFMALLESEAWEDEPVTSTLHSDIQLFTDDNEPLSFDDHNNNIEVPQQNEKDFALPCMFETFTPYALKFPICNVLKFEMY